MTRYAAGTAVRSERTREQMMTLLRRFGADGFGYAEHREAGVVQFTYRGIPVQFSIPLPSRNDDGIAQTPTGRTRKPSQREEVWARESSRRWRSMFFVLKALLVGVEDGVLSFEQAFLPYVVWHDGRTTAQILVEPLRAAVRDGVLPRLIGDAGAPPKALAWNEREKKAPERSRDD